MIISTGCAPVGRSFTRNEPAQRAAVDLSRKSISGMMEGDVREAMRGPHSKKLYDEVWTWTDHAGSDNRLDVQTRSEASEGPTSRVLRE